VTVRQHYHHLQIEQRAEQLVVSQSFLAPHQMCEGDLPVHDAYYSQGVVPKPVAHLLQMA
jgi:hypothetical protein